MPVRDDSLIAGLFDMKFTTLITLRALGLLYAIWVILGGPLAFGLALLVMIHQSIVVGFGVLVAYLFLWILVRLSFEFTAVLFRIERNTRENPRPPASPRGTSGGSGASPGR